MIEQICLSSHFGMIGQQLPTTDESLASSRKYLMTLRTAVKAIQLNATSPQSLANCEFTGRRSADFQSAVSQNSVLQAVRITPALAKWSFKITLKVQLGLSNFTNKRILWLPAKD